MAPHEIRKPVFFLLFDFLLLGCLLAFLFLAPWFYGLARFQDQLTAQILIFILFLTALPFFNWRSDAAQRRKMNPLDAWIIFSLLLGAFYTLLSVVPYQSFLGFIRLFSWALFYALVRFLVKNDARLRMLLWAVLLAGCFYAVYGLLQYRGLLPKTFWYLPDSLASRYVNGGHFAAFLLFALFLGLTLFVTSRQWTLKILLLAALTIIGSAFLLTRARTEWLGFLTGAMAILFLAKRNRVIREKTFWRILFLGLGLGFLGVMYGGHSILRRFQELSDTRFYSLIYRLNLWKAALKALADRPWGWGLAAFSLIFPQYQVQADRFLVDYAHNEFLQAGVDLGIPGILLLLGFVFAYFQGAFFFLQEEKKIQRKILSLGFVGLGMALILTSQFDFPLRIYATSLYLALFLGLSAHLFETPNEESSPSPILEKTSLSFFNLGKKLAVGGLVLIVSVATSKQLLAQISFEKGKGFEKNFKWGQALAAYEKAAQLSPFYAFYHEAVGSLYKEKSVVSFNPEERKKFRNRAIQAYEKAARLHPYKALYPYFLAFLYEEESRLEQAKLEFQHALAREPLNGLYLYEYGSFAVRHGMTEDAINAFEKFKKLSFQGEAKGNVCDILKLCYHVTQDYHQLERVVPDTWSGHNCFGWVLSEKGRWDLAKLEFDAALRQARQELPLGTYRNSVREPVASLYLSHGRVQEALEIYRQAVADDPQDQQAQEKFRELSQKLLSSNTPASPLPS